MANIHAIGSELMHKVRVGVLGAGRGLTFVRGYSLHPSSEVIALCDKDRPRLESAMKDMKIEGLKLYTSYEEMLRSDIDMVVVASDGPLHATHSCMALEAGKHVQSEVPADYTMEGCLRLVETVERTGLKYMMAENSQYLPYMSNLKEWITEGKFGEVVYAEAEYVHDVRDLYYRDDAGRYYSYQEAKKNPEAKRAWRSGIHPIQYITHSLGPILWLLDDRCITVSCLSTGPHTSPEDGNPDVEVAILRTERGKVIKILCAHTIAHPGNSWYTLMGTKGSIETPRGSAKNPVVYFEGEGERHKWRELEWDEFNANVPEEALKWGHGGSDWFLFDGFLKAILDDADPPIDVYRAADYTVPGICAVRSALQGGSSVVVPDLRPDVRNK